MNNLGMETVEVIRPWPLEQKNDFLSMEFARVVCPKCRSVGLTSKRAPRLIGAGGFVQPRCDKCRSVVPLIEALDLLLRQENDSYLPDGRKSTHPASRALEERFRKAIALDLAEAQSAARGEA